MPEASQTIEIDAPPEAVFAVITDFPAYVDFLSEIHSTKVLEDDGVTAAVHYEVEVIKRVSYELKFTREAPYRLSWTLTSSSFMKSNNGSWELEPLDGGARTKATYTVDVEPKMFVPKAVTKMLVGSALPKTLRQFKSEVESRS